MLCPILYFEIFDPPEFPRIVGHQIQAQETGVSRNQHIIAANDEPIPLEKRANLRVVESGFTRKIEYLDMRQEYCQRLPVFLAPRRYFNAVFKFRSCNGRDANFVDTFRL